MAYINSIATCVPPGVIAQSDFGTVQRAIFENKKTQRYVDSIYSDSGIERRHSAVVEPNAGLASSFFGIEPDADGKHIRNPSTGERNKVFAKVAPHLIVEAGRTALSDSGFAASAITHVICVSCTGFFNPGPDLDLIRDLELGLSTQRYQIGFMGCNAAFPALNMANQFCQANQEAVVLIVCCELCSLHMHIDEELDTILANSLFADGAAAVIVSNHPGAAQRTLKLETFASAVLPQGRSDMAWEIGDHGFDIVLSKYVPRIIGANIEALVDELLQANDLKRSAIDRWAVHPGGKSILDKVQKSLELQPEQLEASRRVLRDFGNMSSATVLFVIKDMLETWRGGQEQNVFAMAFGPGLTVETALLKVSRGNSL